MSTNTAQTHSNGIGSSPSEDNNNKFSFRLEDYAKHKELKQMLNDFSTSVLLNKPEDIYGFAKQYFSTIHQNKPSIELPKTPLPVVITGPSGVGKGTLITRLLKEFPNEFGFSVSHTSRKPRPGEQDGVHYHFSDKETIEKLVAEGKFLENATFAGNTYGTSKMAVQKVLDSGKTCILDIDVQGCEQVKRANFPMRYAFVVPPSFEDLEARLRGRGTETEESIQKRLGKAKLELEYARKPGFFDKIVVNDDLDRAYEELKNWIISKK